MGVEKKKEDEVFGEDFNILDGLGEASELFTPDKVVNNTNPNEDDTEEDDDTPEKVEKDKPDTETEKSDDEDEEGNENVLEDTNSEKDKPDSSPITPYAKYLKEEGVLLNLDLDKFDGTVEALKEAMLDEITQGVEDYKSTLPSVIHTLIDNYEEGVPLDTLLELNSEEVRYSSITDEQLEDEETQKQIMTDYFAKTTRFSKEKIQKQVDRLLDTQELESEAKLALTELIAIQKDEEKVAVAKAKAAQAEQEKERVKQVEALSKTIESTEEVVPGIKISKAIKDKIFKNLTTVAAYDPNGVPVNRLGQYRSENPIQTEIILNYIFEVTNQFKDWSVFNKAAKKAAVKEIEDAAKSFDSKLPGRPKTTESSSSRKSFMDAIENF